MPLSVSESEELFIPEYTRKKQSNAIQALEQPFDREQLTKLLINTLHELGYEQSAAMLQQESGGVQVESETVQTLFELVKSGRFEHCTVRLLFRLPLVNGDLAHLLPVENSEECGDPGEPGVTGELLRQYQLLQQCVQRLSVYNAEDIAKLTTAVEIFVLVLRQVFIEMVFVRQDKKRALSFLRSLLRPTIQLWDSLVAVQTISMVEEPEGEWAMTPDTALLQMTTILTCPAESAEATKIWGGSLAASRQLALDQISQYINPNDLVPRGRLITLLKQAIQFQRSSDLLSFSDDPHNHEGNRSGEKTTYNLLQDNVGSMCMFNFSHVKTLSENKDEIWYLQFSPDGRYLASASTDPSSDRKVFIYDVLNNFRVYKVLAGTEQSVICLTFSADSKKVITCPFNEDVKVYNIHDEGTPIGNNANIHPNMVGARVIDPAYQVTVTLQDTPSSAVSSSSANTRMRVWCATWFHHQPNLIALGSTDRDVVIYDLDLRTTVCRLAQTYQNSINSPNHSTSTSPPPTATDTGNDQFLRVHAVTISHDDKYLICMSNDTYIDVYDMSELSPDCERSHEIRTPRLSRLNIGKQMMSMSGPVGPDDSLLLISVQPHELQLWDFKRQIMVQRYVGQRQVAYIIRSCFGYGDNLVAGGSEDGKIYIWDRYYGNIIGVLSGHNMERPDDSRNKNFPMTKVCNTVAWNPVNSRLFASGGDDGLVKIWKVDPN
ncbi:AFR715Cp [Eremothecium gossypii ATCC 10895]|uniref:AFR715Cp n=1 Tax=Eremothecium gossypii (strain ATCC 10895 / CBS 109.51 / FGSC 9923 / NRRL Y-1056) TaxID=284811 RepID=Q751W0_EREGS|nr:AFR715Cp [Eremothecium gossypii ATCC 10895]AAS54087.1 AFR715Cp [Eremothecium gossypii ATCC 10895]AEY98402.1 FAFR715Cp [Eremothecium gossypii FDAG1]